MKNIFEQISHVFEDFELAGILVIVLIVTFIILNVVIGVCVISMRKSLKKMVDGCPCSCCDKKLEENEKHPKS